MACNTWYQSQGQAILESKLQSIFPQYNIHKNIKREAAVKNELSGQYLEVDLWVPELHLCFEFQDYYHYKSAWYNPAPLTTVLQRDNLKRNQVRVNDQTLVAVPCWWGGDEASLQATILFQRPDLGLYQTSEIPINPPHIFYEEYYGLMQASFPESNVMEICSWWIGEKWDGIRCFWDTTKKELYSRSGVAVGTPSVGGVLGNLVLDGEIWCGRGFFSESQAIISVPLETYNASLTRLLCFDEASQPMQTRPFEERYSLILDHLPSENPAVINAPRFLCSSEAIMLDMLHGITSCGGEGVVMRQPLSHYVPGRSDSLFKIKASHSEQEALVVNVDFNGTLLLKQANGHIFSVAKEDCILQQYPTKGDVVSFRTDFAKRVWYRPTRNSEELLDCAPKPVVYRIRSDVSWQDVMGRGNLFPSTANEYAEKATETTCSFSHSDGSSEVDTMEPDFESTARLRSWKTVGDRRAYFDKFAASRGMDPLNPNFWYSVTTIEMHRFDNGYSGISNYGSKLYVILMQLYPNIGLQIERFNAHHWKIKSMRRAFFDKFAASRGMDELNPLFWYGVSTRELKQYKEYKGIARRYGGELHKILIQLYPNIGLHRTHFKVRNEYWTLERKRREYFDKYANAMGADERNPVFWYSVSSGKLRRFDKGYDGIAKYHGRKLSTTLMQLYPDIGLQQAYFKGRATER